MHHDDAGCVADDYMDLDYPSSESDGSVGEAMEVESEKEEGELSCSSGEEEEDDDDEIKAKGLIVYENGNLKMYNNKYQTRGGGEIHRKKLAD